MESGEKVTCPHCGKDVDVVCDGVCPRCGKSDAVRGGVCKRCEAEDDMYLMAW